MVNSDLQTPRRYKRPPIVEASFEVRFRQTLSTREMERLRDRFKRTHPTIEEQRQVNIELLAQKAVTTEATLVGYKLTASNASDLVIIQQHALGSSRLAPYEGWESFIKGARGNFETLNKIVGHREVTRLGARFVNRIDIPNALIQGREIVSLIKAFVALPEEITTVAGTYGLWINFIEKSTGVKVLLQSSIALPPPVLDHTSIVLDIDASVDSGIPSQKEAIWRVAETLRTAKNRVFEGVITDDLRRLFG